MKQQKLLDDKGRDVYRVFREDPFGIFSRLDKIFTKMSVGKWVDEYSFIKWMHQEIPPQFWKYNNLISLNEKRLCESAKNSDTSTIWIDRIGMKNKLKQVNITPVLKEQLESGEFCLPTYDKIISEVYSWGKKTICYFGKIDEQYTKIKEETCLRT